MRRYNQFLLPLPNTTINWMEQVPEMKTVLVIIKAKGNRMKKNSYENLFIDRRTKNNICSYFLLLYYMEGELETAIFPGTIVWFWAYYAIINPDNHNYVIIYCSQFISYKVMQLRSYTLWEVDYSKYCKYNYFFVVIN